MSQYPPGYQQQFSPPAYPIADPRGPAKAASFMMIIPGCFGLLLGMCFASVFVAPAAQLKAQMAPSMPPGYTFEQVLVAMKFYAAILVIGSILNITFGFIVRRGTQQAVIGGLALTILLLIAVIALVGQGMAQHGGTMAMGICPGFIALILLTIQLIMLVRAKSVSGQLQAMQKNAYQAQYWQYMQQQQAYQQNMMPPAGYNAPPAGYTAPPPGYAAPPAYGAQSYNAPPPPTAAPPQTGWQWPGQPPGSTAPPPQIPLTPPPPPDQGDNERTT
jgi:hypothetical protein